jgi:adenosylcobinamide kinase/adenosylcobinamide-phosphate guanylyltransferase
MAFFILARRRSSMIILLTGGVKSGKSSRALEVAKPWKPVTFIATAAVLDDEIRERVKKHQAQRAKLGWDTIEEQTALDEAISRAGDNIVVDCLTMWLNNLFMVKDERHFGEEDFEALVGRVVKNLGTKKNAVLVTNEVGLGNIPFDALTREYNLWLALANREIAAAADQVELMVSGIPVKVK